MLPFPSPINMLETMRSNELKLSKENGGYTEHSVPNLLFKKCKSVTDD